MVHIPTRAANDALDRDPPPGNTRAAWSGTWQRLGGPAVLAALSPMAVVLALALILAPAIRTVAIEVNHSTATVWPFRGDHCSIRSTAGCTPARSGDASMAPPTELPPAWFGQGSR